MAFAVWLSDCASDHSMYRLAALSNPLKTHTAITARYALFCEPEPAYSKMPATITAKLKAKVAHQGISQCRYCLNFPTRRDYRVNFR